jgi:hypothetical protein
MGETFGPERQGPPPAIGASVTDGRPDAGSTPVRVSSRVRMLRDMGLLKVTTDPEGRKTYRLTAGAMRVGHSLAIVDARDDWLLRLLRTPDGPAEDLSS